MDIKQLEKDNKLLNKMLHDIIVGNQSAWIEWKYGKGAISAMNWIENGLSGPGHIPNSEMSKYYKNAQLFYNEQRSDPFPVCPCGNPSSILWMSKGYCCNEHQDMHKAKLEDNAEKETIRIINNL